MYNTIDEKLYSLEEQFHYKVNRHISDRITPLYNMFLLIFTAFFAYFVTMQQPVCYSKEGKAYGVQLNDTVDVTNQFYWLSVIGIAVLLTQVIIYYIQSREEMFDKMRPWVILINLIGIAWFIALQYYRFKDTGRACSGDYLAGGIGNPFRKHQFSETWPKEKDRTGPSQYLVLDQGFWILTFIIAQYALYILCKISSIVMTNKLEAEYEEDRAKLNEIQQKKG